MILGYLSHRLKTVCETIMGWMQCHATGHDAKVLYVRHMWQGVIAGSTKLHLWGRSPTFDLNLTDLLLQV